MMTVHNDLTPAFAIHPGEVLKDMLEDRGWTQRKFTARSGRPVQLINKIINGHSGITAETALDFAQVFEMSPKFWLNLESRYRLDLEMIRRRERVAS
jgi:HTH-type transcriptional regulator/antitoxin HigA